MTATDEISAVLPDGLSPRDATPRPAARARWAIGHALQRALDAARDKGVAIGGGASTAQQYTVAGLVDELEVHVSFTCSVEAIASSRTCTAARPDTSSSSSSRRLGSPTFRCARHG